MTNKDKDVILVNGSNDPQRREEKMAVEKLGRLRAWLNRALHIGKSDGPKLSVSDIHRLSQREFRTRFIGIMNDLVSACGPEGLDGDDMAFLRKGRSPYDLTTREMKQIVLAHPNWFA